MPSSLASSERSGSVKSHHSPKTSLQSKADPNMALYEQEPSMLPIFFIASLPSRSVTTQLTFISCCQPSTRVPRRLFSAKRAAQGSGRQAHQYVHPIQTLPWQHVLTCYSQLIPINPTQHAAASSDRSTPSDHLMPQSMLIANNNECEKLDGQQQTVKTLRRNAFFTSI